MKPPFAGIELAPLLPLAAIAAAGGVAALFAVYAYARPGRPISWGVRCGLLALRLAAALVVLGCLLGPSRIDHITHAERAPLVLLLDASRSMTLADAQGAPRRTEQMNAELDRNNWLLFRLGQRYDLHVFRFGGAAVEGPLGPVEPKEPKTAIGDALDAALRVARGRKNGAVLLLTDGVSNSGRDPARVLPRLRTSKLPIYAVGFGAEAAPAGLKDFKVTNLLAPNFALIHATVPVIADCSFSGYQGKKALVHFRVDGREVLTKWIPLLRDREAERLTFHLACESAGQRKVTVSIDPEPDEVDKDNRNNELSTFVNVAEQFLPILYAEGTLRWEAKFLRKTLESIQGVSLDYANGFSGDAAMLSGKDFTKYRVVILGDLPANLFPREAQERLAKAVSEEGVGLIMLGGMSNFGAGGWGETPVGQVLPVRMTSRDGQTSGSYTAVPSPQGLQHPACQIADDADATLAAWASLPKIDGGSRVAGLKPAAQLLMRTSNYEPLLVEQPVGKGRTMALLADTTWKWAMGDEKSHAAYGRFWKQLVLALAQKDLKTGTRLWAVLDRYLYVPGETVRVQIYAQTEDGRPLKEAGLRASVVLPNGTSAPLAPAFFGDCHHATYVPEAGGEYELKVDGSDGATSLGSFSTKFFVRAADLETDEPEADLAFLRRAAQETGGRFVAPEGLEALLRFLDTQPTESVVEEVRRTQLWNRPSVVLVFALLLTIEWVLRRLKRLL